MTCVNLLASMKKKVCFIVVTVSLNEQICLPITGSIVTPQSKILSENDLSHVNLMEIGKEVGKDWKMLARHLNLPESEIQQIQAANIMDLHEASLQALLR